MSMLKAEIKITKQKLDELMNYGGRIANYEEFKNLVIKVLDNFKPKKKDLEEAAKKLRESLLSTNEPIEEVKDTASVIGSVSSGDKKKGFLGMFANKKK